MPLLLKVVTPIGIALEREVESVVLPAEECEIEILPGHLPLIAALRAGELLAKSSDGDELFAVDGGFAKISCDCVHVLTDESLSVDATDMAAIEEATERAKKALEDARSIRECLDPSEIEKLDAKVKYQMATKLSKANRR
jgi:F-type H+-transporting ATPase subunit epsilon